MKLSKKDSQRELRVSMQDDGFLLVERIRYVPYGYTKAKWEADRIWLAAEEIEKLAAFAKGDKP